MCCYQHYDSPCYNPANSTCCPSARHAELSFVVAGADAKCCGDQSFDYACANTNLVCCPAFNKPLSAISRSVREPVSTVPAPLEFNTEGTCANATTQFCCPFQDYDNNANLFSNSVPCRLGDLCCPGGEDSTGVMRAGGCCFGQLASQWTCGINGAPVCPCGYNGYPECVPPNKEK